MDISLFSSFYRWDRLVTSSIGGDGGGGGGGGGADTFPMLFVGIVRSMLCVVLCCVVDIHEQLAIME